jgi:hypothetical protein
MGKPPRLLPSTKPHAVLIGLVVAVFLVVVIFCFGLFFDCGFLLVLLFALVALKFFFLLCFVKYGGTVVDFRIRAELVLMLHVRSVIVFWSELVFRDVCV